MSLSQRERIERRKVSDPEKEREEGVHEVYKYEDGLRKLSSQDFGDVQIDDPIHHVETDETNGKHDPRILVDVGGRNTEQGIQVLWHNNCTSWCTTGSNFVQIDSCCSVCRIPDLCSHPWCPFFPWAWAWQVIQISNGSWVSNCRCSCLWSYHIQSYLLLLMLCNSHNHSLVTAYGNRVEQRGDLPEVYGSTACLPVTDVCTGED